jgi:hypothetical protein
MIRTEIKPGELADRLAIREFVDADAVKRYRATMHFNGQSTITLSGDRATGESYCIAHHLFTDGGERKLMVAWLRYDDTFVRINEGWRFTPAKALRRLDRDPALRSVAVRPRRWLHGVTGWAAIG